MAKQETISFREFQERLRKEKACREYLYKLRWPEGYKCPKCGYRQYYTISTRNK